MGKFINNMKLFFRAKDGGKDSTVTGYWLIESKSLFSIVLLRFDGFSRDAFHTHAFNSISWLISGELQEKFKSNYRQLNLYQPSFKSIITKKEDFHKVNSKGVSWVLSFRGRWDKTWKEHTEQDNTYTLSKGRKIL